MTSIHTPDPGGEFGEIRQLLDEISVRVGQVQLRFAQLVGESPPGPALPAKELARVEAVGEVAYRHAQFIEEHGSMTLGDSLTIRRELYGDKVRSTANLFGTADSGALFHRTTPYGSKVDYSQEVRLTDEGARVAALWEQLHR